MIEPVFHHTGDRCLFVEFGSGVDPALNRVVLAFARRLAEASLPFVDDIVPSWTGVGIYYRADATELRGFGTPFSAIKERVLQLLATPLDTAEREQNYIEIPVCYGGEFGLDLPEVAEHCGLTEAEVIALHGETVGQVFMVGFAPGHPFIGLWDEKLTIPRRASPRTHIAAGTVAIANRQTNIYPFELPGGWNLIGRTPLKAFDANREVPCLTSPGDRVRFVPISEQEFHAIYQREHAH